ncbi:MAG: dipeptidase [Bryobacteraceae bacterium]|nr:dipeptidase [Bryobacteraceae bacterium]
MRIRIIGGLAILGLFAALLLPQRRAVTDEEVRDVHRSALLIDMHSDVTSDTVKGVDLGARRDKGHTDLPRLREGGVGAVFFAAYVASSFAAKNQAARRTLEMIDTIRYDIVERHPNDFMLALTADDIERARKEGKIAALIGIEGGHAIEDSLRLLRTYYALGVRYMTLTHSNTNNWADSSGDINNPKVKRHGGLTDFGRQVIAEMNRLGMMVDISHVSDETFRDVLKSSKAPVAATHSSCRAISNIARNMTDDMIRALARNRGVICINFGCEFLSQKSADASPYFTPGAKENQKIPPATLDDVVLHIDRVVKLAGVDAVGIGSDFDGVECVPTGLEDVSKFPALTRALLERGYTAEQIRKMYGDNILRLMREVAAAAGR